MSTVAERVERLREYLNRCGWEVFSTSGPIEVWKRDGKYVNVLTEDGPYTEKVFNDAVAQLSKVERRSREVVWGDIAGADDADAIFNVFGSGDGRVNLSFPGNDRPVSITIAQAEALARQIMDAVRIERGAVDDFLERRARAFAFIDGLESRRGGR